ncbi:MAG: protein usg [Proteobacteria bacterium SG_bin9]|nr:MAG: protein usg [Proteobacteria bacterium SG_bin9]
MVSTANSRAASEDLKSGGFVSEDFKKQLLGYGLTTAEILYRRPDRRWLLQSYVWQELDLFPKFPKLQDFLAFWQEKLEGPLVSVTVAHSRLIRPAELRAINGEFRLH